MLAGRGRSGRLGFVVRSFRSQFGRTVRPQLCLVAGRQPVQRGSIALGYDRGTAVPRGGHCEHRHPWGSQMCMQTPCQMDDPRSRMWLIGLTEPS